MALLQRTEHSTYCPYKGDCAYFSIPHGGERSTNAVWTYEAPYEAVASINSHWPSTPIASTPSKNDLETPCRPCINPRGQSCPRCSSFVTRPHLPNQSARDRLHAWDEASFINGPILNVDAGKNH